MFKKRLNILILVLIVITSLSVAILTSIFIWGDISAFNTENRKTFTKEINSNEIKNLSINTDVADLHIKKHNKENFYIRPVRQPCIKTNIKV